MALKHFSEQLAIRRQEKIVYCKLAQGPSQQAIVQQSRTQTSALGLR
jgi:hypothetical protein